MKTNRERLLSTMNSPACIRRMLNAILYKLREENMIINENNDNFIKTFNHIRNGVVSKEVELGTDVPTIQTIVINEVVSYILKNNQDTVVSVIDDESIPTDPPVTSKHPYKKVSFTRLKDVLSGAFDIQNVERVSIEDLYLDFYNYNITNENNILTIREVSENTEDKKLYREPVSITLEEGLYDIDELLVELSLKLSISELSNNYSCFYDNRTQKMCITTLQVSDEHLSSLSRIKAIMCRDDNPENYFDILPDSTLVEFLKFDNSKLNGSKIYYSSEPLHLETKKRGYLSVIINDVEYSKTITYNTENHHKQFFYYEFDTVIDLKSLKIDTDIPFFHGSDMVVKVEYSAI